MNKVYFYFISLYVKIYVISLQGNITEQVGNRFSIMGSPDGFRKNHGDVNHLDFGAFFHLVLLRYGISDHYGFKACTVDARNGGAREDPVSQDGINSGGSC